MAGGGEFDGIERIGPQEVARFTDFLAEFLPADDRLHGIEGVLSGAPGLDQGFAESGEQLDFAVDRTAVALHRRSAAELSPDDAVEHQYGVVDAHPGGFQNSRDQDGMPARGPQAGQVLGGKSGAFLRKLPEPLRMNVIGRARLDADRPQRRAAIEEFGESVVARHSRRLPYPGRDAERRPGLDPQHRIEAIALTTFSVPVRAAST